MKNSKTVLFVFLLIFQLYFIKLNGKRGRGERPFHIKTKMFNQNNSYPALNQNYVSLLEFQEHIYLRVLFI